MSHHISEDKAVPVITQILDRVIISADDIMRNVMGSENLAAAGLDRKKYIDSLVAADRGDYGLLMNFVRS
jgi:hypothetical protein